MITYTIFYTFRKIKKKVEFQDIESAIHYLGHLKFIGATITKTLNFKDDTKE